MDAMKEEYSRLNVDYLSVQNSYPITRIKSSNFAELGSLQSFYKKEGILEETKHSNEGTSTASDILQENSLSALSRVIIIRQKTESEDKAINKNKINNETHITNNVEVQSPEIFVSKSFGTQYNNFDKTEEKLINSRSCTKHNYTNEYRDASTNDTIIKPQVVDHQLSYSTVNQKRFAEKTTYCRPVIDYYNQAFVYETMQRNERLQKLVKKLAIARQRERQTESWNNFINYLKNKHRYTNEERRPAEEHCRPEQIADFYRTIYKCGESRKLRQNFYDHPNVAESKFDCHRPHNNENYYNSPRLQCYSSKTHCYPISSEARSVLFNIESEIEDIRNQKRLEKEHYQRRPVSNTIIVDTKYKNRTENYKKPFLNKYNKNFETKNKLVTNKINSSAFQTEYDLKESATHEVCNKCDEINEKDQTLQQEYKKVLENVEKLKRRNEEFKNEHRNLSLVSIEMKLDTLINSINSFIIEIQSTKALERNENSVLTSCKSCDFTNPINKAENEAFKMVKYKPVSHEIFTNSPSSSIGPADNDASKHNHTSGSELDEIIIEEMDKSEKVKKDIENILKGNVKYPCSVQITVDFPTKERSTEITASLSHAKITQICTTDDLGGRCGKVPKSEKRMTIAVNTDPLGLLALLKVSTETVKQLLYYMPNISYLMYLPMMSLARRWPTNDAFGFVCNICGAAFTRQSLLSDHIHAHNLGHVRDCCVCRHSVDAESSRNRRLFKCRYCGQRFVRAYCCELHEQSCAKTVGRLHDVPSSHMLLK